MERRAVRRPVGSLGHAPTVPDPSVDAAVGVVAAVAVVGFALLTVAVQVGATRRLDVAVRGFARSSAVPDGARRAADAIVSTAGPTPSAWACVVVALAVCVWRGSLRPVVVAGATGAVVFAWVNGFKALLGRPDPGGAIVHEGSFPSGHTSAVVVACGLIILLVRPDPPRWVWLLTAAAGLAMATSLVLIGAHWATDVLGAGLDGTAIIAGLRAIGAPVWAAGSGRSFGDSVSSGSSELPDDHSRVSAAGR